MSSRRTRVWRWLGIFALLVMAGGTAFAALAFGRYPGICAGMVCQLRQATFTESRNLMRCIGYWLEYMQKLERDPVTGVYGFGDGEVESELGRCVLAFHRGEFAPAASCLEGLIEAKGESEERLFWLAMSYLRAAEADNCLRPILATAGKTTGVAPASKQAEHTEHAEHAKQAEQAEHAPVKHGGGAAAYCALPLERRHQNPTYSRRAMATFERLLDEYSATDPLYRWLLTFSAMTVGDFRHEVPARYRIDSSFIDHFFGDEAATTARRFSHLSFVERGAELGVATADAGRGVAVEDFDGDGDLDLVTGGAFESVRFYRNQGGGRGFVDATAEAGLVGVTQPFSISAADYDNDGWVDLFVARPFDHYRLFRNTGGGRFVDTTEASGIAGPAPDGLLAASWTSAWGDVDNDGDLDLFLAQWGMAIPFVTGLPGKPRMNSTLFINDGGRFHDGTRAAGLAAVVNDAYFVGATFGDHDGDGDADLYLSSPVRGTSRLLDNDGGGHFRPAPALPRDEPGFYAAFVDVDHDGRLDLFQGGFSDATTSTQMTVFGEGLDRFRSGHSTILHQLPDGGFEERNDFFTGEMPMATMGASYGDLDNDGCLDFYLGTGNPEGWFVLPNLMYLGEREGRECSGRLANISSLEGFGTVQKGHGIVFFDFDDDGDQDVYSALGGMWPADSWPNQLFVNESELERAWVKIRLRGRRTNRFGIGARITVVAEAADGAPIVRRYHMDNKTGFGSAPYLAHIGLLDAVRIREIEVFWPVSGCRHSYRAELNQLHHLDEAACDSSSSARPALIADHTAQKVTDAMGAAR